MMVSFDTNILVYATLSAPLAKTQRARDLLLRGMRTGSFILLLHGVQQRDAVRTTIDAGGEDRSS